jgi:hypothetical protein
MIRVTDPNIIGVNDFGSFYDTTSQTGGAVKAMKINTTDFASGVSIVNDDSGNPTRITFSRLGKYNLAFSAQIVNSGGQSADIYLWLRHQGVDVPDSATVVSVGNNSPKLVAAWNFFLDVNTSPQYFELMWYTSSSNVSIAYIADASTPADVPAVPSLIVTANRVGF